MKSVKQYRRVLEQRKGALGQLQNSLTQKTKLKKDLERDLKNIDAGQLIIQHVAQETQKQIEYHISALVTSALEAVFPNPYEFRVEFVQKRNKTEAVLRFMDGKQEIDPMTAAGGGVVDIAAFALRIAMYSISQPSPRSTIVLDEPFRFLSSNLQPKAGQMLKELSKQLHLQFIIVTHNTNITDAADRIFTVKKMAGVSVVEEG